MRKFKLPSLALLLICISCNKPLPTLDGVDIDTWRNDRHGCSAQRVKMIDALKQEKVKLLALGEVDVIKLLGKPDRNELSKRNQKFYYYFLEPSEKCQAPMTSPKKLVVRFNAVGLAKEVLIE